MSLQPLIRLRFTILLLSNVMVLGVVDAYQVKAQVSFNVSETDSHLSVRFSDSQLIQSVNEGTLDPQEILKVYVATKPKEEIVDQPAIWGTYQIQSGVILFKPLVPFSASVPYLAVFGDSATFQFQLNQPQDRPVTRLLQVYPTVDTVPANLLKLYLEFSAPMREGEVYEKVRIFNARGELIDNPFVPLKPELWDASGSMVTLWLDPGRVKRALLSREAHGPVLEAGENYRLVVDKEWKDAQGQILETGFTKLLYVGADDRTKPLAANWKITSPAASTQEPLMVWFGEPMDYATALHAFRVTTKKGEHIPGSIEVVEKEHLLLFIPINDWYKDTYNIYINSKLEDLAGNNLNRLFDRDLSKNADAPSDRESYLIEFEVNH